MHYTYDMTFDINGDFCDPFTKMDFCVHSWSKRNFTGTYPTGLEKPEE